MPGLNFMQALINHWQLIAIGAGTILASYYLIQLWLLILNRRYLSSRNTVWLEVIPPANIAKTPEATEQLFAVLYGLRSARSLKQRLMRRLPAMCFEIVSTKRDGVRYLMQLEATHAASVQKILTAYIPEAKVKMVPREIHTPDSVTNFTEAEHYILPITLTSVFAQHDPLSYVTNVMTRLEDDEEITLQLVAQPIKLREASRLSRKIMSNENILEHISGKQLTGLGRISKILNSASHGLLNTVGEVHAGTTYGYKDYYNTKSKRLQQQALVQTGNRPARTLSTFELELMETMHQKVNRPLFQVDLRLLVTSNVPKEHVASIRSALDGFSVPPYQSLKAKMRWPILHSLSVKHAHYRLPSVWRRQSIILSAAEIAALYHFPPSQIGKTDNLVTSLSRTLAAPVSLKKGHKLDIVLGVNKHHSIETLIGLTEAERERHIYIIGGTGNGKTTMLQYGIVHDIQSGKGVAVIDPHGDLAETLLKHVPEHRLDDVVYINPDDYEHPVGLNLLEIKEGLTGHELLREKDLVTESTISVLRKLFSDDDSGGHRIEYILRNTIQTALTIQGATLFTIFELLNDTKYRRKILKTLEDKDLKNFWVNELGKAGDMQKVKMAAGITSKIGRFLFSASAKRIIEQEKSTIDFDDILDSGKILICNFSKGLLGEDTSTLFGTTVLAKLQMASLRRARQSQADRRPFYLYVDEFQNFATMSFVQMLSEARKYKLFLTMAEQSTQQQADRKLVDIILANVGTVVCFRSGSPADEQLILPLFSPYIEQGEIANLPAYSFYCRISSLLSQEPMSGTTILLENSGDASMRTKAIERSRAQYAIRMPEEQAAKPRHHNDKVAEAKPTLDTAQVAQEPLI